MQKHLLFFITLLLFPPIAYGALNIHYEKISSMLEEGKNKLTISIINRNVFLKIPKSMKNAGSYKFKISKRKQKEILKKVNKLPTNSEEIIERIKNRSSNELVAVPDKDVSYITIKDAKRNKTTKLKSIATLAYAKAFPNDSDLREYAHFENYLWNLKLKLLRQNQKGAEKRE